MRNLVLLLGVYQITFTAKYVSSSKGRFGAWSDVFVNDTVISDSQREYNGNDMSDSESSTHSIIVIQQLSPGDRLAYRSFPKAQAKLQLFLAG